MVAAIGDADCEGEPSFASLDLDSTGHGMRLTNGDGATTVNLTTAAADITACQDLRQTRRMTCSPC